MRKTILFFAFAVLAGAATAQTVSFGYDAAGNRTSRTIVLNAPAHAPAAQSAQAAEAPPLVEQIADDLQLKIFPNPTAGLLNVEIAGLAADEDAPQIAVFAQSGQQVLNIRASGTRTPVDLSAFPAGAYILRLIIRGKTESFQIIKK